MLAVFTEMGFVDVCGNVVSGLNYSFYRPGLVSWQTTTVACGQVSPNPVFNSAIFNLLVQTSLKFTHSELVCIVAMNWEANITASEFLWLTAQLGLPNYLIQKFKWDESFYWRFYDYCVITSLLVKIVFHEQVECRIGWLFLLQDRRHPAFR